jgi:predicted nucleic acid-binding protein
MTTAAPARRDRVLLDTDVFSYLLKGSGENAERYRRHVVGKTVAISFVTIGEIYSGFFKRGVGRSRLEAFEATLHAGVVIVPYNLDICVAYERLAHAKTEQGSDRTIAPNDRWIAACAIHHALPLVTNNAAHFVGIPGLIVITESRHPQPTRPGELFE